MLFAGADRDDNPHKNYTPPGAFREIYGPKTGVGIQHHRQRPRIGRLGTGPFPTPLRG